MVVSRHLITSTTITSISGQHIVTMVTRITITMTKTIIIVRMIIEKSVAIARIATISKKNDKAKNIETKIERIMIIHLPHKKNKNK